MGIRDRATPVDKCPRNPLIMLYGNPNIGKTITAARLGNRNLILTDESGHISLQEYPELANRTEVAVYQSLNDIRDVFEEVKKDPEWIDTLILDTFTGIQGTQIKNLMTEKLPDGRKNPLYFELKGKNARDNPEIPSWGDYHLSLRQWGPVLQSLAAQSKLTIILNCHVRFPDPTNPNNVRNQDTLIRPDLTEKVYKFANGKANMVAYLHMERTGNERLVRVRASNQVAAKTQIQMPDVLPVNTFVDTVRNWRYGSN